MRLLFYFSILVLSSCKDATFSKDDFESLVNYSHKLYMEENYHEAIEKFEELLIIQETTPELMDKPLFLNWRTRGRLAISYYNVGQNTKSSAMKQETYKHYLLYAESLDLELLDEEKSFSALVDADGKFRDNYQKSASINNISTP